MNNNENLRLLAVPFKLKKVNDNYNLTIKRNMKKMIESYFEYPINEKLYNDILNDISMKINSDKYEKEINYTVTSVIDECIEDIVENLIEKDLQVST
jgi:hypothetical protein